MNNLIDKYQIIRITRLLNYMFWTFGEQAVSMGVPRLLLFPIAAYFINKENFGIFITTLSIVSIIGVQPSNGLAMGLLRQLKKYPEQQQAQYCRTAMQMSHNLMLIIISTSLFCTVLVGVTGYAQWTILNCLIPLIISLYSENQFSLLLTKLRINRKFKVRTLWYTLRAGSILFGGIAGIFLGTAAGFAWGYTLGSITAYIILRVQNNNRFLLPFNPKMAQSLKSVWIHMTIAGAIVLAGLHLNRIILSIWHAYTDVADLFAATSVVHLFLVPVSCCGGLLLSILAKYESASEVSRLNRLLYFLLMIIMVVGSPFILMVLGPLVLQFMFPKFVNTSFELLNIVFWGVPFTILTLLTRPFTIKFAAIQITPFINGICLAGTLIPTIILVPYYGAFGAAWAIVIGQGISGLLWLFSAISIFFQKPLYTMKLYRI